MIFLAGPQNPFSLNSLCQWLKIIRLTLLSLQQPFMYGWTWLSCLPPLADHTWLPKLSLISQTPLIFTAALWRTSSLFLTTMNRDPRTALGASVWQVCLFHSLVFSQCTLIFLLPSGQWPHGTPPTSLLQTHSLVQILTAACVSNQPFSWPLPISWASSGKYCYLPSPPARTSLLLHTEQGMLKHRAGEEGDFHLFLIVSKLKKTEPYMQFRVQDSYQGALTFLTLQPEVQIHSSFWPAPAPEYLHEPVKADLASSLFWIYSGQTLMPSNFSFHM